MSHLDKLSRMYYQSSIRGVTERDSGLSTVYWGVVRRISKEKARQDPDQAWTEALQRNPLDKLLERVSENGKGGEIPEGAVIELYEIWDVETGDVLMMWRVPIRLTGDYESLTPEFPAFRVLVNPAEVSEEVPNELRLAYIGYLALKKEVGQEAAEKYLKDLQREVNKLLRKNGLRLFSESEVGFQMPFGGDYSN